MDPEVFQRANGYPNNYYGWGGEDTALVIRLNIAKATFFIPKRGFVIDNEMTDDVTDAMSSRSALVQ